MASIARGSFGRAGELMQSSGVGNCSNMFSLLRNCGFAGLLLVTMRGEFGEFNPWQVPMGNITQDALLGARVSRDIPRPPDRCREISGCLWMSVSFGEPENRLLFDATWLDGTPLETT
jgi:sulfopyruvate decarboxylase TPP-binding subunit